MTQYLCPCPILFVVLIFLSAHIFAQPAAVSFDYERASFNNFQPLPAEQPLLVRGALPADIDRVEVNIHADLRKAPLLTSVWKRPAANGNVANFEAPLNFRLQPSRKYDFRIDYFRPLSAAERLALANSVLNNVDIYLGQAFELKGERIQMIRGVKRMLNDLFAIVSTQTQDYRNNSGRAFEGFSEVVAQRLRHIERIDLTQNIGAAGQSDVAAYARQLVGDLKQLIHAELAFLSKDPHSVLADRREATEYETERRPGFFSIHAGYGAVYLGGNIDQLIYDDAPYLGVALPFSTRKSAPAILRNAAITLSVFLRNLRDEAEQEVSGPIIGRPLALGLDYKLFQFIYLNGGAALLERRSPLAANPDVLEREIFIQPYLGVHAKVNLSLSFGN
jgi:hypothetical protein